MSEGTDKNVVVIKRKKKGHGGHHGGAWKVAYADFVTAMMALFIVLWLMNADPEKKKAIAAFFNSPSGPGEMKGMTSAGAGNAIEVPKDDMGKLREKLEQALKSMPDFGSLKEHMEMILTPDGLRIELLETEAGVFFESGRPVPSKAGEELLACLAAELGRMPNHVLIEGHTDSRPFAATNGYSNWELSADRANAGRKLMQEHGLRPEQVAQVRGFADKQLRHPENPEDPSNRRISVIVQYLTPPPGTQPAAAAEGEKSEEKSAAEGPSKVEAPAKAVEHPPAPAQKK